MHQPRIRLSWWKDIAFLLFGIAGSATTSVIATISLWLTDDPTINFIYDRHSGVLVLFFAVFLVITGLICLVAHRERNMRNKKDLRRLSDKMKEILGPEPSSTK